ncbi:MAG: AMP-binding protein, partial [Proteobacteria bacterium]|nr:AMP-binding protein [Pseudomonadota bacterium]
MEPVWLQSYPAAVDPTPPIRAGSVAELIVEHCQRFRDREAFWSRGRALSFGECLALAQAFCGWLDREGVAAGERVAIMLPNVLAYPVACYGTLLGGRVVVNVNPQYTARELVHQLGDAGARTLVVWEPALAAVEAALGALALERVVVV